MAVWPQKSPFPLFQPAEKSACKDAGKLGVEGKEYIVEDGDIMHFRFNV